LQIQTELNKLRVGLPNAQVTTYTYEPLAGIVSQTDIKNQSTYYEYDGLQRLMNIRDQDKNVIKNFSYNYKEAIRGNAKIARVFRKNTCPAGSYGEKVEFVIPADKYYGKNQTEANNLALNDLSSNGQQYANNNGQCFPNGIYVSLCSDRGRTVINGNYRYIYATYTISVYRDHYGSLLNLQPVDISYSRGNSVQVINVISTFNLGEIEVQREYIGPRPAGTEGEIISNLVSINYSPNYNILLDCSSGIEPEPEVPNQIGLASGVNHNMVRFDSLLELCGYTAATDKDITNVYYEQDVASVIECFTNSNKTAAVADGYYTFFKSVDSGPNKWFKIQFGRIVEEATCN
jgi:YD repeat-containing protein